MGYPGTGTVPDLAADVVEVVATETVRTAEAEMGVGEMVRPRTPPHQDGQKNQNGQNGQDGSCKQEPKGRSANEE